MLFLAAMSSSKSGRVTQSVSLLVSSIIDKFEACGSFSRVFQGCHKSVSREFQGCLNSAFSRFFKSVS